MATQKKIELLAPARDLETGRVAVDAGADAIYIGGPGFGARRAAGNSVEEIAALVRYARPFGVRIYATLNTLLFENELKEARQIACALIDAGVDALIVQDMAWLRMGLDGVELHASTQTSNIVPEEVAFLGRAGFRRVILERALSLPEIEAIRAAAPEDAELEAFVHGAICVGYSGRCFMSAALGGGRSGNRGDCSQPCRLAYNLTDGEGRTMLKNKHLLSVRDLDLSARLGELLDAGVSSFKIEGRLKDAGYVRNVVSHYRALLDAELLTRPHLRRASIGVSAPDFTPDPAKSFTRGGTDYFFDGARAGVASFDTPKAMGELLGTVSEVGLEGAGKRFFEFANLAAELASGDGICFFADGELRGTNINRIEAGRIYPNDGKGIATDTKIFRNYDHAFVRILDGSRMKRRIGVTAQMTASPTTPTTPANPTTPTTLTLTFTDETGLSATARREGKFEEARDPAKMAATVREQLSKSGDTIFEVRDIKIPSDLPFIPVSTLVQMRREGLSQLSEARENLAPERNPAPEDPAARFPRTHLTCTENVTNSLSERFWRDHGITEIDPALELKGAAPGDTVMRTRYCIRREIGQCLKECLKECPQEGAQMREELFLERGRDRWRLAFDCNKCEMKIEKI
jgi:putative protease